MDLRFLRFRILLIFGVGILFLLIIVGRTLQLQLLPNERLFQLASRQHKKAVTLYPKRGTIFDQKGKELAVSRQVGSIYANPKKIRNRSFVARKLSRLTGIPYSKISQKLKSKRSFVWIQRLTKDTVTETLKQKPIEGVGIIDEYKRFYPNEELAGQVLGMVGMDSKGVEGLEYQYNEHLQGEKKSIGIIRDALGRVVSTDEPLFMETQEGNPLHLTLDKTLQFLLEKEIKTAVDSVDALQGLGVIQDAHTGALLAVAQYPFFNANRFGSYQKDPWKNRAVTDAYEPGSTFKVFLSALALEEGISPQEKFYCENGLFRVNRKDVIREAEQHKFQWLKFQDILKFSSNIGAVKLAYQVGELPFHRKILEFGFGQKTGVDMPGESLGIVRAGRSWEKIDLSTIAFGQGISTTPIQLVTAMSAIANGGRLMAPHIVAQRPKVVRRILSERVSKQLTDMLIRVTDRDGTGFLASLPDVSVAGKTGTAQKPNLKTGGYWPDKYIASFLGFFPAALDANTPKYTILIVVDEPKKFHYASQVAAPIFKVAASHTLRVFPSDQMMAQVPKQHEVLSISRRIQTQVMPKEIQISSDLLVGFDKMPDLTGRSMREVLQFTSQVGLDLKVKGSGIVVKQSIAPGKEISKGQKISVTLSALNEAH